ncbi:MAG: hypothetical protein R3B98_04900 [Hyphomonas sp.]
MSSDTLESRLFRRSFDDGWLDVLVGSGIVLIGLSWLADMVAIGAVIPAALFPFWKAGRQKLIEPRQGSVAFGETRQAETRRSLAGWAAFGAGVLALELCLFLLQHRGILAMPQMADMIVGLPALLVGVGLLAGLMIGARRFAVYAALAGAIGIAGAMMNVGDPGWLILAIGLVILAAGTAMLVHFLATRPAPGAGG